MSVESEIIRAFLKEAEQHLATQGQLRDTWTLIDWLKERTVGWRRPGRSYWEDFQAYIAAIERVCGADARIAMFREMVKELERRIDAVRDEADCAEEHREGTEASRAALGIKPTGARFVGKSPLLSEPYGRKLYEVAVEVVTPERALEWLTNRRPNRVINNEWVCHIMDVIKRGDMAEFSRSSPMAFDVEGHLTNGQHRLEAIVRTGIACPVEIMRPVKTEISARRDTDCAGYRDGCSCPGNPTDPCPHANTARVELKRPPSPDARVDIGQTTFHIDLREYRLSIEKR
jgi:hypothetical protein